MEKSQKNQIELKPLKFNLPPTLVGQIFKIEEEDHEFLRAIIKCDVDNAIEEFYDKITSSLNALRLIGIPLEIIVRGEDKHYEKLSSRGWQFEKIEGE